MPEVSDVALRRLMQRGIIGGRSPPTRGAGFSNDDMLRSLYFNNPGMMGGGSKQPGFNPSKIPYKPGAPSPADIMAKYPRPAPPAGMGEQPNVNIPIPNLPEKGRDVKAEQNPAIVPYIKLLKEEKLPFGVYVSPKHGSAYISYGPKGNERMYTLRVPHPDNPHVGKPREGKEVGKFIDTAGLENVPKNWYPDPVREGPLRNAAGGSFADINNVKDAIKWQMGKLVPVGSEPFQNSPDFVPRPPKGAAFHPPQEKTGQGQFMTKMMHGDEKIKMPTIMGGDPNSPLHSQQLNQRFNLVNPQDLGNYGSKEYNPLNDPSYLAILKLLGKPGPNTSNDR